MLIIGTFRKDIKEAVELNLSKYSDRFTIKLLNKKQGILAISKDILSDIDVLFTTHLSLEELEALPKLKSIFVPMTGLDGLDEAIVNNNAIEIINAHSTAPYIAERGMGLLMALAGRIPLQSANLKEGIWNRFGDSGKWYTLQNKKIGIYGYGHIGKAFEQMMRPFTSDIYTIDRKKKYPVNIKLVKDLKELALTCDILFVAVPGNSQTQNTIDEKIMSYLKDGIIINVGRGKIIEQNALFNALDQGILKGFASDVWYNYPNEKYEKCNPSDVDLSGFEQVVMTPHNAWNHDQKEGLVINEMLDQLRAKLS